MFPALDVDDSPVEDEPVATVLGLGWLVFFDFLLHIQVILAST
jgi:hypothetical protein